MEAPPLRVETLTDADLHHRRRHRAFRGSPPHARPDPPPTERFHKPPPRRLVPPRADDPPPASTTTSRRAAAFLTVVSRCGAIPTGRGRRQPRATVREAALCQDRDMKTRAGNVFRPAYTDHGREQGGTALRAVRWIRSGGAPIRRAARHSFDSVVEPLIDIGKGPRRDELAVARKRVCRIERRPVKLDAA